MAKFVVTGAAGFIGSHLAARLGSLGHDVLGVDSFTPYYGRELKESNLAFASECAGGRFDFREMSAGQMSPEDLRGTDVVIHLAAQPGVRASWQDFDNYLNLNLSETNKLTASLIAAGVPRLLFASSSSVYGNAAKYPTAESDSPSPRSPYGVTKLAGESLLRAYVDDSDLSVVALRFFTVYGPGQRPDMAIQRLISAALGKSAETFQLFGDGHQRRDFTFVEDVVSACVAAATAPMAERFLALNVGGSGDTSMIELFDVIESASSQKLVIERMPEQRGDVRQTGAEISRAKTWLGWSPETKIREGIERHVAYMRSPSAATWSSLGDSVG